MNRRSFLAALAAPLIARPTLEDIERLTWRRRFHPAYPRERVFPATQAIAIEALRVLEAHLVFARYTNTRYGREFREVWEFQPISIRKPQRFVVSR